MMTWLWWERQCVGPGMLSDGKLRHDITNYGRTRHSLRAAPCASPDDWMKACLSSKGLNVPGRKFCLLTSSQ
jgi:hypothetical protein